MKNTVILLLIVLFVACQEKGKQTEKTADVYLPVEKFVDSTEIGKKGHNKVEITLYANDSTYDCFTRIYFYSKGKYNEIRKTDWWFCEKFIFDDYNHIMMDLLPDISDFNNDGYNDFTYHSIDALRLDNDVRKLFIYSPEKDKFIYIKNSEYYPNLKYNKYLDCITSCVFTGTQDEYFLKIENDSLVKIAHIEIEPYSIVVYEIDKNNNEKQIEQIENTFEEYPYFKNWKPLELEKE